MMNQETSAQIIYDRAFALVLDARRWPHTKAAAHRYILLGIRWAMAHGQRSLTEKLSGFSLQLGEING